MGLLFDVNRREVGGEKPRTSEYFEDLEGISEFPSPPWADEKSRASNPGFRGFRRGPWFSFAIFFEEVLAGGEKIR